MQPPAIEYLRTSDKPTRAELRALDSLAAQILPNDPTPSLDEIVKRPDIPHMGQPTVAPQKDYLLHPLRIIVAGSDAALSLVVTRLMRSDRLWAEVAFIPTHEESAVASCWGLPRDTQQCLDIALNAPVAPMPLIRDDTATALMGRGEVSAWDAKEMTAEIVVDDEVLLRHQARRLTPRRGIFGARLAPMLDAPGLAAVVLDTPVVSRSRLLGPWGTADPESVMIGRALQAGGEQLRVTIDGISRPRATDRVTFYRHLRDLQAVRPA
ncbi:hypothetical protein N7326_06390 [Corynebacterium sp. ES2794-CONJ1]|uniref:hypothetical protein n=1 Tax=unclassified Corynebacterium TaxID=2624378 RepID=UPI00216822D2|nr:MULTISPECIES: hypothetical protein [unclassified Corynebacterium]MCS4491993.1 hypothetical protein [Corynebacterium sp. ES2715-CONJ3]MCS4532097.1 hypothetical protein [Corynebacterium sp. ES2730-CONJ]MCU9519499.1 hypothetical protein [Corynebacterium sp. ES2794-CONJ1]